jgi:opacity protein-like surface antigen
MIALAFALGLALGPGEDRLPRSLAEEETTAVFVGLHLGGADAVDGGDPGLLVGLEWRMHILPWLGVAGGIDFLGKEDIETISGGHFIQVPFTWSFLLSPPIDLGVFRPYGMVGGGFTITDVSGEIGLGTVLDSTDFNLLYHVGFGVEIALGPNLLLDVNARYVWAHDPPHAVGFDTDWRQATVGILVKLPR